MADKHSSPLSSQVAIQENSAYDLTSKLEPETGTNGSPVPKDITQVSEITFPEGGLQAWLVVFGVTGFLDCALPMVSHNLPRVSVCLCPHLAM